MSQSYTPTSGIGTAWKEATDAERVTGTAGQQFFRDNVRNAADRTRYLSDAGLFESALDLSTATAGQVKFPATQNPSANANTLDDYEEGNWTPVPTSLTVVGSPTYTGKYTKIGRVVHCQMTIVSATSTASSASNTYFTGLPYAVGAIDSVCVAVDQASVVSLGNGLVTSGGVGNAVYTPTWSARASVVVSFSYIV
jgi:hypothetical protein